MKRMLVVALSLLMLGLWAAEVHAGPVMPKAKVAASAKPAPISAVRTFASTLPPGRLALERAYIDAVPDLRWKKILNGALNYQLKSNETFDEMGNIRATLASGKIIVLNGYDETKLWFESEMMLESDREEWPELKALKEKIGLEKTDLELKDQKAPPAGKGSPAGGFFRNLFTKTAALVWDKKAGQKPGVDVKPGSSAIQAPIPSVVSVEVFPVEIKIKFSEDMDEGSIRGTIINNYLGIQVQPNLMLSTSPARPPREEDRVEGKIYMTSPRSVFFQPHEPLVPDKTYYLTVTTGVKSASGFHLAEPYYWNLPYNSLYSINPLFDEADFSERGLMRYAADLYERGTFPFFPYLTPARDQAHRGTCQSFAKVAALELLSLKREDLSEQNARFALGDRYETYETSRKTSIGLESEWPYNPHYCTEDKQYHSDLLNTWIPCSVNDHIGDVSQGINWGAVHDHQGVPDGKGYKAYDPVVGTEHGRCYASWVVQTAVASNEERSARYWASIVNELKYPIAFGIWLGHGNLNALRDGFVASEFFGDGTPPLHDVLIVGYVPNSKIPEAVKSNPNFQAYPKDGYFIIKNSWGNDFGDSGFMYVPESLLELEHVLAGYDVYRYDRDSEKFEGCDSNRAPGVVPTTREDEMGIDPEESDADLR